ncbi:MAG: hypothetical protein K1X94_07540 [Sandaracinaceae bacterium]|nr:hypothetical protein [Sandaracinaceae bacterium]
MNHPTPASSPSSVASSVSQALRAARAPSEVAASAMDREAYIQSLMRLRSQGLLPVDPVAIADAILRRELPGRRR